MYFIIEVNNNMCKKLGIKHGGRKSLIDTRAQQAHKLQQKKTLINTKVVSLNNFIMKLLESFTANVAKQLLLLCSSYALVLSKLHCISSFNVLYIAIYSAWFII
uniref:Uncharacterized protein n=1 Tax=Cacopsylla melanoneura TaxID=428564 RepID=A0A8D8PMM0_9HEMI